MASASHLAAETVTLTDTTTTVVSSANSSAFGQSVTFTATVSPTAGDGTPTGSVSFLDDGTVIDSSEPLVNGSAEFTTSALAVGDHTITASYSGDGTFNSSDGSLTGNPQVVTAASTTTTVQSSANPSVNGQVVVFTVTVAANAPGSGTPTGIVTLYVDGLYNDLNYLFEGSQTFYVYGLGTGDHTITAAYGGSDDYGISEGSLADPGQVVDQAATTTTVTSSLNPSVDGLGVTFTAEVDPVYPGGGNPTGTVDFFDGGDQIGSADLSGRTATFTTSDLAVGDHTITTTYAGDTNFTGSDGSLNTNPQVVNPYPIQGAIRDLTGCRTNTFARNDDSSVGPVDVGFSPSFYGLDFSQVYVNNNGNLTIGRALSTYTPYDFTLQTLPLIGPYFGDVDTRGTSNGSLPVTYGTDTLDGHAVFCVNYVNVGYYGAHTDKLNSFQVLLIDRSDVAPGDFDIEFDYGTINWETGDASGGSGGFGGVPARAGWTNGDGDPSHSYTFAGSGISMSLEDSNLDTGLIYGSLDQDPTLASSSSLTSSAVPAVDGRYIFAIRNLPPTGSTLQGTVTAHSGSPAVGSTVQVCDANENCQVRQTDSDGMYVVKNLPAGSYTVKAGPPPSSNDTPGTGGPVAVSGDVPPDGVFTQDVQLGPAPGAPPDGTTVPSAIGDDDGVPVVYWQNPMSLETHGCPNGTASYQLTVEGVVIRSGSMDETSAGSGDYVADNIQPPYPSHGNAQITMTIVCPNPDDNQDIGFGIYIDPSGIVTDVATGQPIAGATVTLLRSDSADGPFVPVPDGSTIMSADNRSNPSTTGSDGSFAWDVVAGYYEIQATASGCNTVTTDPYQIPPPVTNLDLQLDCGSPPAPQLSVTLAGTGTGWVTSDPSGIDCVTGTCMIGYAADTPVTLTANVADGYTFEGWSGACTGTGQCQVTMDQDRDVTATFSVPAETLTVSKTGTGHGSITSDPAGVSCGATCQYGFAGGTDVTLTATSEASSTFGGWSGACTGTGACHVTMDQARSVSASFVLRSETLSVTRSGTGSGTVSSSPAGVSCGSTCAPGFDYGTQVTLTATPAASSTFAGWSGSCSGTSTCQVTMSEARSVTATFVLKSETLSVTSAGAGTGTVSSSPAGVSCGSSCSHGFDYGTKVTLTAAAASGSTFNGWSGACSGTGACQVTMDQAQSVTATFAKSSSKKPKQCVVPNVKGKTLAAARSAITKANCAVGKVAQAASKKVAKGKVVSQSPAPGKHAKKGSKVNLVVSKGKKK